MSKDKTIKRYFLNTYNVDKLNYKYREYSINTCSTGSYTYTLDNHFLFNQSGELEYNNCINIRLEDPHAWSWHFDEDSSLENTWELFKKTFGIAEEDCLKDQLFYSFYVANWNVKEIKSIDLVYKKVLLNGFRKNIADEGNMHEYYDNENSDFSPMFYKWNDSNSKDKIDISNYLGSNLNEVGSKIDYTHKTITSEEKTSVGIGHDYTWKSILTKNQFKDSFGEKSNIYKFADNYFNNQYKNYWIINYDDFFYSYKKYTIVEANNILGHYFSSDYEDVYKKYDYEKNLDFYNYLTTKTDVQAEGMMMFNFSQEYTFDIQATNITFEDYAGVEYTYPVSVASVNQEGSGGTSEEPFTWLDIIKIIFCVVFGLIALIFLWPLLLPIGKIIVYIISIPFKALYKVIKNRGNKK